MSRFDYNTADLLPRRRKRQRYTVDLEGHAPQVILAYSHGSVVEYYERRGYKVLGVEMGDYRKRARQEEAKQNGRRFAIDTRALEEAKRQFGLKRPVKIRLHGRVGGTNGNHSWEGTYHNVMLKWYRSAEEANETLWHELTHCRQAEECMARGGDWHYYSRQQKKNYSYKHRPIEIEARQVARSMRHIMLVRAI